MCDTRLPTNENCVQSQGGFVRCQSQTILLQQLYRLAIRPNQCWRTVHPRQTPVVHLKGMHAEKRGTIVNESDQPTHDRTVCNARLVENRLAKARVHKNQGHVDPTHTTQGGIVPIV